MSLMQNFLLSRSKDIRYLCNRLTCLNITRNISQNGLLSVQNASPLKLFMANIHTTLPRYDLMEFFDDPKNWGANEVRSGRSWKTDELRIKSNSDLHKLWYVLLKERNMLKTMEHECNERYELFPSPERIDKVQDSMDNLETVVRERNRAYHLLETGKDGERPGHVEANRIGMRYFYRETQHFIPKRFNKRWRDTHQFYDEYKKDNDVTTFLSLYREKLWNVKRKAHNRNRNHVTHLLRRYPNLSRDLLKKKYPDVNVDMIDHSDKARGHYAPKID